MKKITVVALFLGVILFSCNDDAKNATFGNGKDVKMKTMEDSISYIIGYNQGQQLKMQQLDEEVNMEIFNIAMAEGMAEEESKIDQQSQRDLSIRYRQVKMEKMEEERKRMAAENLPKAEQFIAEKEKESGVLKTESGLLYKVIQEGTGKTPTEEDRVKVHYHGTLADGTVFDSSVDRGQPSSFGVNQVIAGWTEGLQLMKEGAKYEFYIHPDLGYKEQDKGTIQPNSALVFEVELIEVEEKK